MNDKAQKYFITAKKESPLLELLKSHLPTPINAQIVLQAGGAWHNRTRLIKPDHLIKKGETLTVYVSKKQETHLTFNPKWIVEETKDFLVVHKPANVSIVSDRTHLFNNLTSSLATYYKQQNNPYSPSPITRLDYVVEGLVLYPKHKQAEINLFKMTQSRHIGKVYLALLESQEKPLSCKRVQNKLSFTYRAQQDSNGKASHSLFIHQKKYEKADLYSVILFTGRRHQIRCHASEYLSPIIGDHMYASKRKTQNNQIGLFAYGYNFTYQNKRYKIRSKTLKNTLTTFLDRVI